MVVEKQVDFEGETFIGDRTFYLKPLFSIR